MTRSIASLAEKSDPPENLWYYGDLDAKGLEMAQGASATAAAFGLPAVRPAVPLYRPLLDRAPRSGIAVERTRAAVAAAWLPRSLYATVADMLVSGRWVPPRSSTTTRSARCSNRWPSLSEASSSASARAVGSLRHCSEPVGKHWAEEGLTTSRRDGHFARLGQVRAPSTRRVWMSWPTGLCPSASFRP